MLNTELYKQSQEIDRLRRVLATQSRSIARAFRSYIQLATSNSVTRQIRRLVEAGEIENALAIADSYVVRLVNAIRSPFRTVASNEIERIAERLRVRPNVAISFDELRPSVVRLMQQNQLNLVTQLTDQQRASLRRAFTETISRTGRRSDLTRAIRNSIGLTTQQLNAIDHYRNLLEQGSRDALEMTLRDRRFDSTVENVSRNETPLTPEQINRMVDRYRFRQLNHRASIIAGTESLRLVNQARHEALVQAADQAEIPPENIVRVWQTIRDGRQRHTHDSMHGQTRGLNEPFVSPSGSQLLYPGDISAPAKEIVNCRCIFIVRRM